MSDGRVLQVNIGQGGVPKLPVPEARVTRLGLEGDRVRETTLHGGPCRAICLFGIEVIERLLAEGHPTKPGGVGENLTTGGIDWSTLPAGTRIKIGDDVLLELTTPANPCSTQKPNFQDGRFGRISVLTHPADSRMYASVLREGTVRPGDPIGLLPAIPGSTGTRAHLMGKIDRVEQQADLRLWATANAGGWSVDVLDDGELSVSAAPGIPRMTFNHASGLRTLPHLLPMAVDHFTRNAVTGWLPMHEQPWPGAEADFQLPIFAAPPSVVDGQPVPPGIAARVQFARELGCDVVTAQAGVGTVSTHNLLAVGLEQIAVRDVYRFDPSAAAATAEPAGA